MRQIQQRPPKRKGGRFPLDLRTPSGNPLPF